MLTKLSAASIIVGIFMPLYAWLFDVPGVATVGMPMLCLSGLLWLVTGIVLFKLAMRLLREVR